MSFPVAEFHHMTGHLRGIERGALRDILFAQWMEEYKAVNLDDKRWFLNKTNLDPRQYQAVCKAIKPFFRKDLKGYYFEFGEDLFYEAIERHLFSKKATEFEIIKHTKALNLWQEKKSDNFKDRLLEFKDYLANKN